MDGVLFGLAAAQAIALLISVTFVTYVVIIVVPFLRHKPHPPGDSAALEWHLFVPALNEEKVIAASVQKARETFPYAHVWVVDDHSVDSTPQIVGWLANTDPYVHVVSRRLPAAQTGKGDALNAAYRALDAWLPSRVDRRSVVVGVIDADGVLAPNCLDVCAADHLFGDPEVSSVQISVRMVNRDERRPFPHRGRFANAFGRTLVRLQDIEFRAAIAAIQLLRQRTGTVGLGGNGQFTRLSALDHVNDVYGRPWHGALLEDYELSLHLLTLGHRNEQTLDTVVDQEGLPSLRRLLTQRTRWGQGTMQCGSYLPRLWTSRHVSTIGALEASYYLIQPWLQLIGTIVYPIPLAVFVYNYIQAPEAMSAFMSDGGWLLFGMYAVVGVLPFVLWGPFYLRKCEPDIGLVRAIGFGLAYSLYIVTFYITSWRAFFRIVQKRRNWVKTARNAEPRLAPVRAGA